MYIYTHTHTHTYIHIYIHPYIHTYIYIHTHIYVYIYIYNMEGWRLGAGSVYNMYGGVEAWCGVSGGD